MENPIKMDHMVVPLFQETSIEHGKTSPSAQAVRGRKYGFQGKSQAILKVFYFTHQHDVCLENVAPQNSRGWYWLIIFFLL